MTAQWTSDDLKTLIAQFKRSPFFFENLLDMLPDLISYINKDHVFEFANQSYLRFFKLTPGEMIGLHPKKVIGKAAYEKIALRHLAALSGEEQNYEGQIPLPDGTPFHFQAHYLPHVDNGRVEGFLAVVRDISKFKQAQAALFKNKQKYKSLFNNAIDPIFITQNKAIILANPATERLIGYSGKELRDMPFIDIIHPEDRPLVTDMASRRLTGEDLFSNYTHRALTKNGDTIWVDVRGVKIDWDNQPASLIFVRDITERKRLEIEKEQYLKKLEQALEEIKTLKGILPICSRCKKIRDDQGDWNYIESYISNHSDASFSHGMCPQCLDDTYGTQDWYIDMKRQDQKEE
ncbi:MAG TPA: hypothetical protein DHV36_00905 [Desulfobacteraceae bacterium]|nr:hypothetical protein [Desulfobacteraceae bacterium]